MANKFFVTAIILIFTNYLQAQKKDTLHLYYSGMQTKLADSNEVKIDKWVRAFKGKKFEYDIIAYYEKGEFKQVATDKIEELYLVINRKARDFSKVGFQGAKKGNKAQRTNVDIVYIITEVEAPPLEPTPIENKVDSTSINR